MLGVLPFRQDLDLSTILFWSGKSNLRQLILFTLSSDVVKWRMLQQNIVNVEWQKLMHDDYPAVANLAVPRDGMTTMIMRRWLSTRRRVGAARLTTSVAKRFPVMRHSLTPGAGFKSYHQDHHDLSAICDHYHCDQEHCLRKIIPLTLGVFSWFLFYNTLGDVTLTPSHQPWKIMT